MGESHFGRERTCITNPARAPALTAAEHQHTIMANEGRTCAVDIQALSPEFSRWTLDVLVCHYVSRRIETETVPILVNNTKLYRIGEALSTASLSRATYFRWLKAGKVRETQFKDRNGRRLFTEAELQILENKAKRLVEQPQIELTFGEMEKQ